MRAGECKEHDQGIINGASWKALLKDERKFAGSNESWHSRQWRLQVRKPSERNMAAKVM